MLRPPPASAWEGVRPEAIGGVIAWDTGKLAPPVDEAGNSDRPEVVASGGSDVAEAGSSVLAYLETGRFQHPAELRGQQAEMDNRGSGGS